ncbi:hypothetical protein BX616_007281 [Lobosporangium transversale]|nr:hypothetical protein BX616_007281 [Lobosporangium transversale]
MFILYSLIKETSADESFTSFVAHRWGPVFLRPLEETAVTLHDKHPQRMMRDMLKMTHQIFEPIRMSREEGNLSRSVTTRAPATALNRRKAGMRASRDLKGASALVNGNGHVDLASTVPSIAVDGEAITGQAAATTATAATVQDGGSGVGTGSTAAPSGAKLQRRLGPSGAGRFSLTRGVSAPEMFSEVPSFKKKPAVDGTSGVEGDASTANGIPGLLNTTGLQHAAGGDKNSRSPLRQSVSAPNTNESIVEVEEEEDKEDGVSKSIPANATDDVPYNNIEATTETTTVTAPVTGGEGEGEQSTLTVLESIKDDNIEVSPTDTEATKVEDAPDWKAVSGAEFESTGRKLERRRKNRQSTLSNADQRSSLVVGELSAESVLQALQEEDK